MRHRQTLVRLSNILHIRVSGDVNTHIKYISVSKPDRAKTESNICVMRDQAHWTC